MVEVIGKKDVLFERYYPSKYRARPVSDQVETLKGLLPELKGDFNEDIPDFFLPMGAEGWYALPRWELVAENYGKAVERVVNLMSERYGGKFFADFDRVNAFDEDHIRQYWHTEKSMKEISKEQDGCSILVVPAQFGLRYKSCSVERVRSLLSMNEFCLGWFEVLCMLLANPQRLGTKTDLGVDSPGTEYHVNGIVGFSFVPFLRFRDSRIQTGVRRVRQESACYGSATALLL